MSHQIQSIAYRLRSVSPTQEFKFTARVGEAGSQGSVTLTVQAKDVADAWWKVVREHRGILPHLCGLTLLGD